MSPLDLFQEVESFSWPSSSENHCLGTATAAERVKRYLDAVQAQSLAQAATLAAQAQTVPPGATFDPINGIDAVAAESCLSLSITRTTATNQVVNAIEICQDLPAIWQLVYQGTFDWRAAVSVNTQMRNRLTPGSPAW
ncbi:hypothetical protein, partial [Kineosporia sp. NBRC 101731]|uniref:hypothetical protein n=1 Tax=Kineosporia sp. NBRC 101731 TaxID=3032199 RepID=UPI0025542941